MNLNTILNVSVAVLGLGVLGVCFGAEAVEFVNNNTHQTVAYAGFGGLVVTIVGVGSALLSPRRF